MPTPAPPRAAVTRADIDALLPHFYAAVRAHDRLGPIFHRHVGADDADWAPHLAKIGDFWANVMLKERVYQGNPMQAHLSMPEIREDDFAIWLGLFDRAAAEVLTPDKAALFSTMAHRIGRSLAMGVAHARGGGLRLSG